MAIRNKGRFKVKKVVVCDFIRKEDNGKHILIGVYSGGIYFDRMPGRMHQLSFWVEVDASEYDGLINIQMRKKNGKVLFHTKGSVDPRPTGEASQLTINVVPFIFEAPGIYQVQAREDGAKWRTIETLTVDTVAAAQKRGIAVGY